MRVEEENLIAKIEEMAEGVGRPLPFLDVSSCRAVAIGPLYHV